MDKIVITECPRDAMQGLSEFIPTALKVDYINSLLKVGFDVIDFGSFVSPKAIPQLADTADVVKQLDLNSTRSKLLAIVANTRGAAQAAEFDEISLLGFPFSVSATFQKRNTNSTIAEAVIAINEMQNICIKKNKQLVVYLSMGFGNPYGDPWNIDIVSGWAAQLAQMGVKIISVADTVGIANAIDVGKVFIELTNMLPNIDFGVHLHCRPDNWKEKVEAAYNNGCQRFDSAMKGFGGCPFAEDDLVGNLATENLLHFIQEKYSETSINSQAFAESLVKASTIFH